MRFNTFLAIAACAATLSPAIKAQAQDGLIVVEEDVTISQAMPCKTRYFSSWRDNWFVQMGAGINSPFVENHLAKGDASRQITAAYNLGFGKWFTPYLGWRLNFMYTNLHWQNGEYCKARSINANADLIWDMLNSVAGVNTNRVFSVIPFVGIGGTYNWNFRGNQGNDDATASHPRKNQWTLPVSAGLQLRLRMCRYADFFIEGRASFYGDNYNNYTYGSPIDVNLTAIGGFSINIGGAGFNTYNPCREAAYIAKLNNQVNHLRADAKALAATNSAQAAALAAQAGQSAEGIVIECPQVNQQPLLSTVRFSINSDVITAEEMVNVYNVAQWLTANPSANVVISGYADRDTGSDAYNLDLSRRRAQAVYNALTGQYGIGGGRLTIDACGSDSQPYGTNDWNRIVIFSAMD